MSRVISDVTGSDGDGDSRDLCFDGGLPGLYDSDYTSPTSPAEGPTCPLRLDP